MHTSGSTNMIVCFKNCPKFFGKKSPTRKHLQTLPAAQGNGLGFHIAKVMPSDMRSLLLARPCNAMA